MSRPVTRREFTVVCTVGVAGCAQLPGQTTPTHAPDDPAVGDAEQVGELGLASPAFDDGEPMPGKYGRDAQNVNPPSSIGGVPDEAASRAPVGSSWRRQRLRVSADERSQPFLSDYRVGF